ncbi:MAG: type I DNA topoisomerase [Ruminococcaceae bacterium]|nr:type I DNA topoisomerase [Oscillospiraceae bacterium]
MANLVIVESPAKAKTIAKYLGSNYKVKASMGHIRDLPRKKLGVDTANNFEPQYIPIEGKDDVINDLLKAAKGSEKVYLATDPDREGEAISWHLAKLLGLDEQDANRITFNEITKRAVSEGIENPRQIDLNLVDAQQARRILDRLVGYQLSPFLWKKVRRGLSAGRVQSVVTRMIVDREREIRAFKPKEYWSIDVFLQKNGAKKPFTAKYYGTEGKKAELSNEEETQAICRAVQNAPFTVKSVKLSERKRNPPPPFITSTLQQDASRRLGMQSKRTMAVAQQLYEGIELEGRGMTGLITYMRTDSVRLSDDALNAVRGYIKDSFGTEYCPRTARVFKTRGGAQDAHEAIRPSDVTLTPDLLKNDLSRDQLRLYRLIWERFVACQMAAATYHVVSAEIESAGYEFRASGQTVKFKGYTALYVEKTDEEEPENSPVPADLAMGEELKLESIKPEQHFTQPPPRYNEASLVKAMEEKGIGRPSTYAPTISTIIDRDYVSREEKQLKPTPLGEAVTDLMIDKFTDIVDIKFTAGMEDHLDRVESGEEHWKEVLANFYRDFDDELKKAEEDMKEKRVKIAEEPTDEVCENCGKPMVIKYGRFGRFMACTGYPDCKTTKPLLDYTVGACPICGGRIVHRKSKKGVVYYNCEKGTKCGFITWDKPLERNCPKCGKTLFQHSFRGERGINCLNPECDYKEELAAPKARKSKKNDAE